MERIERMDFKEKNQLHLFHPLTKAL